MSPITGALESRTQWRPSRIRRQKVEFDFLLTSTPVWTGLKEASLASGSSSRYVLWKDAFSILLITSELHWFNLSTFVTVCGRPAAPNMLFNEQVLELSLQNLLSLSLVHLCGTLYLQISDSRLALLFLNA